MRPEKLVMENFGPFSGRAELDFSKLEEIFLITGKTGAGKTTIFDAICFALYGRVPGSRGDHPARLRSDHAREGGEEGECVVSLEFSLGEKRYLAERSPRQERKKKRGEGTVSMEETLVLCETTGGAKTNLISKKSEGDAKLKELLGLEAEEFFKIVLLPQGEFAEFLKENTSERQKVLGKLFPVEKAARVKELARKKANEAGAMAEGAARVLADLSQKASAGSYEKVHAEAAAALEAAGERSLALEKEEALLNSILSLRRNERDAEERLGASRKQLEESVREEASVNGKNTVLARSRMARPLEQFLRGLESAELAAGAAEAALVTAGEEKDKAEKEAAEAERANSGTPALENEILALREKRPALLEMRNEEEALRAAEGKLTEQEELIKDLSRKILLLEETLENREVSIYETEALAAEQPFLETEHELAKSVKDAFMEFRRHREHMDELEKERLLAEEETADLCRRAESLDKRIPVLREELRTLREEKAGSEQADMAAHLSLLLEKGKPCPVCGSTDHPRPAVKGAAPFGYEDRIGAQEASLLEAENSRASINTKLEALKKEIRKTLGAVSLLEKETGEVRRRVLLPANYSVNPEIPPCLESGAPLPSREFTDRVIKEEADKLNVILARQKSSRDAAGRINGLHREKAETQKELGEAEKRLAAAEEQKKNLAARITEGREKRRALLAAFSDRAFISADSDSAAHYLTVLDRLIAEKEGLIARLRETRENAMIGLSAAKTAWEGASRNRAENAARQKDAKASLDKALSNTDFRNSGEAEKALLETGDENALDEEIRLWRENRAALNTRIAEQEKQLLAIRRELSEIFQAEIIPAEVFPAEKTAPGKTPTLGEAGERLEALAAERAAAEAEKNRAFSALTGLEKDRQNLEEAVKRHDALAAEAGKFRMLSDDLSGKNAKKLPFDSWLLANYLEEAAAFATARLEKMSESRYSLLLDTESRQGRGYAGLDLLVFDAYTGKTRPCATLSGGESFMASISLALGLADSIQNRSGGVRLDAVFIDEGFGSLDETSLDKALVILDELRSERMVGLISHVGELRSRIPCRVEVIKTAEGSRIETGQK